MPLPNGHAKAPKAIIARNIGSGARGTPRPATALAGQTAPGLRGFARHAR